MLRDDDTFLERLSKGRQWVKGNLVTEARDTPKAKRKR